MSGAPGAGGWRKEEERIRGGNKGVDGWWFMDEENKTKEVGWRAVVAVVPGWGERKGGLEEYGVAEWD